MKDELLQMLDEVSAVIRASENIEQVKNDLEQVRIKYLGKKGRLTEILKKLGTLSADERPVMGAFANDIKVKIEELLIKRHKEVHDLLNARQTEQEKIDISLPSRFRERGKRHPVSQVISEIEEIFISMGFEIAQGPEVEFAYYNFDALNMPKNHPARELGHTFYISRDEENVPDDDIIMRTHT